MTLVPEYNIVISERARQMLGLHIRFLANVDVAAAHNVKAEIIQAICSLLVMPHRFPFFNAEYMPSNKYHKMYVKKWYVVLSQVKDQTVYVDYILDCRQDYEWLLE